MTTLFKYVQVQDFSLAGAGAVAGGTTLTLKSFRTIDGVLLTMNDFGAIGFGTLEPGNGTQEEQISFTGVVQNASGTATLTGVKNVLFINPYTATSGLSKTHAGSTPFIISNTAGFYDQFAAKNNDEVINAYWEGLDPITPQGYVTNAYMLALINGGAVSVNRIVELGIAGENLVAGDLIYFSEVDNEWLKTDADTLATVFNVKLGIAQGTGSNGTSIVGGVLTRGSYTTSGLVQGDLCYASNTAGGINSGTPGTVPRVIGIAKDSTTLYFDPDFQNHLYDYAVDSVGTDAYAVTLSGALSIPFVGMEINFKAGTANTGTCTLAINGGAAKTIVKNVSDALVTGDILANQIIKVVYDGTNWLVINASPMASTTVKGDVEQATPAEFNAGTQTGGSGAPLFINPLLLPAKNMIGALGATVVKTYFNIQLPFLLWTGAVANDTTTTFVNWVRTGSDVEVTALGVISNFIGTGADSIISRPVAITGGDLLDWGGTNTVVLDYWAILPATATGDILMGFSDDNADFVAVYTASTRNRIMFAMSAAGAIYTVMSKAGVGSTQTDISSGITNTVWNNFRIELDLSNNALFYVNGVLKATMSGANFPTSGGAMYLGFGRSNTALYKVLAPNLGWELNP